MFSDEIPRHEAADELSTSRIMRHGFVWWLATFSSVGGLYHGYCLGLVGGLVYNDWDVFQHAFPQLIGSHGTQLNILYLGFAMVGALPFCAGAFADAFGRKAAISASDAERGGRGKPGIKYTV